MHYQGDNNAVGSLCSDCVMESRWRWSWRNASFSPPHHPRDPAEGGRERGSLRVMSFHLSYVINYTKLLPKLNFNHVESRLIFYIVHCCKRGSTVVLQKTHTSAGYVVKEEKILCLKFLERCLLSYGQFEDKNTSSRINNIKHKIF